MLHNGVLSCTMNTKLAEHNNIMDDPLKISDDKPTRADAVKNRALLLDTARRLADTHGMDHVSMNAIAEAAQVGKGTLYRHFANKAEVCQALLDHEQQQLQERTIMHLRQGNHPLDDLRWFLPQVLTFVWNNAEMLGATDQAVLLHHPAHLWWRQTIHALMTRVVPESDVAYFSDVLYILLDAQSILFQRERGMTRQEIEDGLIAALLKLSA